MSLFNFKLSLLLSALLSGCSILKNTEQLDHLSHTGHSLIVGCEIYDLNGNLKKSYPGAFCLFQNDGTFISFDTETSLLTKYDKHLKKLWSIKKHFHHYITKTANNNILLNSSQVKDHNQFKNVRFDELVLINQEGEILQSYLFEAEFSYDKGKKFPMTNSWDPNIQYRHEFTHLASSYEINQDFSLAEGIVIPKGSILATINAQLLGLVFLDAELKKILHFIPLSYSIHDAQVTNAEEIMFFKNNLKLQPKTDDEKSGMILYNFKENKIVNRYVDKSYGLFGGSVQKISEDLFMMCDTGGKYSLPFTFVTDKIQNSRVRLKEHQARKSRVVFYTASGLLLKELHFKTAFNNAKVEKLDEFLKNNIGP